MPDPTLGFLKDPDAWPNWPICPVVNRETGKAGIVIEGSTSVWLANMFDLRAGILGDILPQYEEVQYPDLEALADAWRVD